MSCTTSGSDQGDRGGVRADREPAVGDGGGDSGVGGGAEPQHLAEIAKRAQKLTGPKNVKLKTVIDKSLLAGIIIRIIEEFGALFIKARICPSKGGDRFQL
ncbi:hypothetical protein SASPL_111820 [Salvia splendens]|uniref:Uncharacterized protein n=1 Tax=Salvia splendens TaxID=180675 RepID=A0A8X9A5I4_SALSN|nr:hypothetical protein SASPL_111820 [Salvia splendens]